MWRAVRRSSGRALMERDVEHSQPLDSSDRRQKNLKTHTPGDWLVRCLTARQWGRCLWGPNTETVFSFLCLCATESVCMIWPWGGYFVCWLAIFLQEFYFEREKQKTCTKQQQQYFSITALTTQVCFPGEKKKKHEWNEVELYFSPDMFCFVNQVLHI